MSAIMGPKPTQNIAGIRVYVSVPRVLCLFPLCVLRCLIRVVGSPPVYQETGVLPFPNEKWFEEGVRTKRRTREQVRIIVLSAWVLLVGRGIDATPQERTNKTTPNDLHH